MHYTLCIDSVESLSALSDCFHHLVISNCDNRFRFISMVGWIVVMLFFHIRQSETLEIMKDPKNGAFGVLLNCPPEFTVFVYL